MKSYQITLIYTSFHTAFKQLDNIWQCGLTPCWMNKIRAAGFCNGFCVAWFGDVAFYVDHYTNDG